jgi:putative GTP pyrophosphokinase
VRIICSFPQDIYTLANCLVQQDDITLINKKDYVQNPKPSGYRSLHLIVSVPIFLQNEKRNVKVEVQLRTIAMDNWASLEHKLRYKKNLSKQELEQLSDELNECAQLSAELDYKMQSIHDKMAKNKKLPYKNISTQFQLVPRYLFDKF